MASETIGKYNTAEKSLSQIQQIREKAETSLKRSLNDKHTREENKIDDQNRQEFEAFTYVWEQRIKQSQENAVVEMQKLKQKHAIQL